VSSDSVPFSPLLFAQDQGTIDPMSLGDPDEHRGAFEIGRIDYTGRDRFQHIQEHLDSHLK